MNKADYIAKHKRRMILFEKQFLKPVFNALHSQIQEFITELKNNGLQQARHSIEKIHMNANVGKIVREIYLTVGLYFIKKTIADIQKQEVKATGFGENEQWIADLIAYFKSELLSKVVIPISESTKNQILEILIKAEHEGWGVDQIIRALDAPELTIWRARLIVRTETIKAMFYGQKRGIQDSNFETTHTWLSAHDHRTRHSHILIDQTTVDVNVRFQVARFKSVHGTDVLTGYDYMEGPGDPSASIENLANCRCTKVIRVKRDENGRAIRKRNLIAA